MTAPPDALAAMKRLQEQTALENTASFLRAVEWDLDSTATDAENLACALEEIDEAIESVLAQVERSEQETKQEREGRLTALAELAGSRLLRMKWQEKATKLEQARDAARAALKKIIDLEPLNAAWGCTEDAANSYLEAVAIARAALTPAHPSPVEGDDTGDGGTPLQQPR